MTIQVTHKTIKKMQTVIPSVLSVRRSMDGKDLVVITKDETPQTFSIAEWDFEKRVSVWVLIDPALCEPMTRRAEKTTEKPAE